MYDDLVVCVRRGDNSLTEGKIYKIVREDVAYYKIRKDSGLVGTFYKTRFISVNKLLTEDWINE